MHNLFCCFTFDSLLFFFFVRDIMPLRAANKQLFAVNICTKQPVVKQPNDEIYVLSDWNK